MLTQDSMEPVYMTMSHAKADQNLSKVSPFLIKKRIDALAKPVLQCKKMRNGTLLIKCKNKNQANSLRRINQLTPTIPVKVEEHNFFNMSKGKIFSRDFKYISDEELLEELTDQKVTEIKRIKKRDRDSGKLTEEDLGIYILTFKKVNLPNEISIGYERIKVNVFIPNPMRCFKCYEFGHVADKCTISNKICPNCSQNEHSTRDPNTNRYERCTATPKCSNCKESHNSFSRECPVFKREFEIQRIRITRRTSYYEAKRIFFQRQPLQEQTYAEALKQTTTESNKEVPRDQPSTSANINTKVITKADGTKVTLASRNTPKHKLRRISNANKKTKPSSIDSLSLSDMSFDNE